MSANERSGERSERIHGYCALCVSRCGSIAVVENDRFVALEPDASHPTGQALCAKGRAAPELVYHPDRLLYPLKRTRPKGDPDPGWQRISWDEALDLTVTRLRGIAEAYGPESVVFSMASTIWLGVRPGADGALALGMAGVMIERGWYDREFIRDWTNGPLLVRADNGRLLTQSDLGAGRAQGSAGGYAAWSEAMGRPIGYDPATGGYEGDDPEPALTGTLAIKTPQGEIVCRPAFELTAELCRRYPPERVEAICGIERPQIENAARMLWEARPVAYYAWSGVEMQTNATQIARAIAQLYALTGSFDASGGNTRFQAPPTADAVGGADFNLIIGNGAIDPVSGLVPHRAYMCEIRRADRGGRMGQR